MKPMSHNYFMSLVCLANIDPTNFGGCNHLVLEVQRKDIIKNDMSTPTTNVSAWKEIDNRRQYWKKNLDIEMSAVTRNVSSKKALGTKEPVYNDHALQPESALARRLNSGIS